MNYDTVLPKRAPMKSNDVNALLESDDDNDPSTVKSTADLGIKAETVPRNASLKSHGVYILLDSDGEDSDTNRVILKNSSSV